MPQHTNALIHEKSPYLLQHAHNPVDWQPWGDEAFQKAEAENKLVIVSIGYSACHWCHVMEHETFEDSAAAALMNTHFTSIKVDREEHPDVDQVYMTAVQLMSGHGGWPLNVVVLPDGRPIWGGTYFKKEQWMNTLKNIVELYEKEPEKVLDYATRLTEGVRQSELVTPRDKPAPFTLQQANELFENWQSRFDSIEGGPNRAPKFPMPNNYAYLLQYGHLLDDAKALAHVRLTLDKMALSGLYDQVGGGFARYSTDEQWKVPHFEKMLYDNAQLIALYTRAWQKFKDPLYAKIVRETVRWAKREMLGAEGQFYAALDADSEGEEGKFYVWKKAELEALIPETDWADFTAYYALQRGLWEEGNIILMRNEQVAVDLEKEGRWQDLLLKARTQRVRPGLDDKALTSWNALMISALAQANTLSPSENEYLHLAEKCADWLMQYQVDEKGHLRHAYKQKESYIPGLLEDYAHSIEAFLSLYSATGKEVYLNQVTKWWTVVNEAFLDSATSLYYTRGRDTKQLIAQSIDIADNVIPSANSVLAKSLFVMGRLTGKQAYTQQAEKMLSQLPPDRFLAYGESYSNWAQLHLWFTTTYHEVAISGTQAPQRYAAFQTYFLPNSLFVQGTSESEVPLLEKRFVPGKTLIYVCEHQRCQLPVREVEEAIHMLQAGFDKATD